MPVYTVADRTEKFGKGVLFTGLDLKNLLSNILKFSEDNKYDTKEFIESLDLATIDDDNNTIKEQPLTNLVKLYVTIEYNKP